MKPLMQIEATALLLATFLASACSTEPYAATPGERTDGGGPAIPANEKPAGNIGQETS
jgi:hypothetical protein